MHNSGNSWSNRESQVMEKRVTTKGRKEITNEISKNKEIRFK